MTPALNQRLAKVEAFFLEGGFRDPKCARALLSCFGLIRQRLEFKRHLLRASLYRKHLAARLSAWCGFTGTTQISSTASWADGSSEVGWSRFRYV